MGLHAQLYARAPLQALKCRDDRYLRTVEVDGAMGSIDKSPA